MKQFYAILTAVSAGICAGGLAGGFDAARTIADNQYLQQGMYRIAAATAHSRLTESALQAACALLVLFVAWRLCSGFSRRLPAAFLFGTVVLLATAALLLQVDMPLLQPLVSLAKKAWMHTGSLASGEVPLSAVTAGSLKKYILVFAAVPAGACLALLLGLLSRLVLPLLSWRWLGWCRPFALCLAVLLAAGQAGISIDRKTNILPQPNIVLIVIDTLRADHLPMYGYKKNTAPFLKRLADQGIAFEHAYAPSSWTAPSTASIFTSLYPTQHGLITGLQAQRSAKRLHFNKIPARANTIAEVLKNSGYATYAVTDNVNICRQLGFDQGFDRLKNYSYQTADVINRTLRAWSEGIVSSKPYFLYIHYNDPHGPYQLRDPWFSEASPEAIAAYDRHIDDWVCEFFEQNGEPDCVRGFLNAIAAYDSEINYVDDKIRKMFELFGWASNTLLIVTADHGEAFNEHNSYAHGMTLFNEEIRIPLIMHSAGGALPSVNTQQRVSTVQIMPTIRSLIGLPPDKELSGGSLLAPDSLQAAAGSDPIYSHLRRSQPHDPDGDLIIQSVITDDWKYLLKMPDSEQLFNLKNDPAEQHNLLTDAAATAQRLRAQLQDFEQHARKHTQEHVTTDLDQDTMNALKSLGYVQ
ncbi:sulfatase [Thermodesulfobacteriota bacterium]